MSWSASLIRFIGHSTVRFVFDKTRSEIFPCSVKTGRQNLPSLNFLIVFTVLIQRTSIPRATSFFLPLLFLLFRFHLLRSLRAYLSFPRVFVGLLVPYPAQSQPRDDQPPRRCVTMTTYGLGVTCRPFLSLFRVPRTYLCILLTLARRRSRRGTRRCIILTTPW